MSIFTVKKKLMLKGVLQENLRDKEVLVEELSPLVLACTLRQGNASMLGLTVEEEYGGMGLGYYEHCIAVEEVSKANAAMALSYLAVCRAHLNQIRLNGSEEQKHKYLYYWQDDTHCTFDSDDTLVFELTTDIDSSMATRDGCKEMCESFANEFGANCCTQAFFGNSDGSYF
jgi:hypothetical protein